MLASPNTASSDLPMNRDTAPRRFPAPSSNPALILWLTIQTVALTLAAAQVRLSVGFPEPPERMAGYEMAAVQAVAAGLLFPILLTSPTATIMAIATSAPFAMLAGHLAATPPGRSCCAWGVVAVWTLGLALWRPALRKTTAGAGVAAATLLTVGGPVLAYLRRDFAADAPSAPSLASLTIDAYLGPVSGAWATLTAGPDVRSLAFVVLFAITAALVRAARGALRRPRHRVTPLSIRDPNHG